MNWKPKKAGSPHEARPERNRQTERANRELRALVGPIRRGRLGILDALLNHDDGKDVSAPSPVEQTGKAQAPKDAQALTGAALTGEAANALMAMQDQALALHRAFAELQAGKVSLGLVFAETWRRWTTGWRH